LESQTTLGVFNKLPYTLLQQVFQSYDIISNIVYFLLMWYFFSFCHLVFSFIWAMLYIANKFFCVCRFFVFFFLSFICVFWFFLSFMCFWLFFPHSTFLILYHVLISGLKDFNFFSYKARDSELIIWCMSVFMFTIRLHITKKFRIQKDRLQSIKKKILKSIRTV